MKTSNLMIGDILSYDNKLYKVDAINVLGEVLVEDLVEGHWDSVCIYSEEDVHPIKLSIEMLLDNGFTSYRDGVVEISAIGLILTWDTDRWFANWGNLQIRCVHELQHLLRLCGLSDFANNFKVD